MSYLKKALQLAQFAVSAIKNYAGNVVRPDTGHYDIVYDFYEEKNTQDKNLYTFGHYFSVRSFISKMDWIDNVAVSLPMIGMMKAKVLPDPVLAAPRISNPRSARPTV